MRNISNVQRQSGAALIVGLVLLAVLMILGVSAVRTGTFQEKSAANVHQYNMMFNAAAAGAEAFTEMANAGNDVANVNHILFRARTAGNVSFCLDENGNEAACGGTTFDGNAIEVAVNVERRGCVQQLCFGFSLGIDSGGVQCLVYEVDSTSSGTGMSEQVEWWAYQISAQC